MILRVASSEITSKIGYVPNLSLGPPPALPKTLDKIRRLEHPNQSQPQPLLATHVATSAATVNSTIKSTNSVIADFGAPKSSKELRANTLPPIKSKQDDTTLSPKSREKEKARPPSATNNGSDSTNTINAHPDKLTIVNHHPNDKTDGDPVPSWQSATEEKLRLRQMEAEKAKASVSQPNQSVQPVPSQTTWVSAEDEKRRLFREAQSRANRSQNQLKMESRYVSLILISNSVF
jgi:hypothetical protein